MPEICCWKTRVSWDLSHFCPAATIRRLPAGATPDAKQNSAGSCLARYLSPTAAEFPFFGNSIRTTWSWKLLCSATAEMLRIWHWHFPGVESSNIRSIRQRDFSMMSSEPVSTAGLRAIPTVTPTASTVRRLSGSQNFNRLIFADHILVLLQIPECWSV